MGIQLNSGQIEGYEKTLHWLKTQYKQVFEICGPAGTGKTTLINHIVQDSNIDPERILYVALVGRMALVMRMKGLNGKTIHSTICEPYDSPVMKDGKQLIINNRPVYELKFRKVDEIKDVDLIILDEAGVVEENLAKDLLSFGIPVLALGDLDQLEPPFGKSYFLKNPDIVLWEIMRQMEDDPILDIATRARMGLPIPHGKYGNRCYVIKQKDLTDKMMKSMDIIICATNKTRNSINTYMRENVYGHFDELPMVGDKLICRKNNWNLVIDNDIALINGMVGYVENPISLESLQQKKFNMDFRPDFLKEYYSNIEVDLDYILEPCSSSKKMNIYNKGNKFEYGYASTGYLAQGSEYNSVMLFEEPNRNKDFIKRYTYTGVTRAKSFLIYVKQDDMF